MAEKDTKPKTATKAPASKPNQTVVKKTATAAPAKTTATTASKTTVTAKSAPAAKPNQTVAKKTATVAPAKTTATTASKAAVTAKPVTAAKPNQTVAKKTATVAPAKTTATTASKATVTAKPNQTEVKKTATTASAKTTAPASKPASVHAQPVSKSDSVTSESAGIKKSAASQNQTKSKTKTKAAAKSSGGSTSFIATLTKNKKLLYIVSAVVAFVLILAIILGSVLGTKSCGGLDDGLGGSIDNNGGADEPTKVVIQKPSNGLYNEGELGPDDDYEDISLGNEKLYSTSQVAKYTYDLDYATSSLVGYSGKVIGTVERNIPEKTRDEGLGAYPKYGYTLSTVIGSTTEAIAGRNALIAESSYLTATGTANAGGGGYTWMDEDGYLYSGTRTAPVNTLDKNGNHRRLYKHSASVGLYLGDVSDDEPGIIKEVTMRPRGYSSYGVTGIYAPAGELIKIQMTDADMTATGGIVIHIGQALYNGQANNIWTNKGQMQRIPHLLNTMQVTKNTATYDAQTGLWTAYVGSFIGGPIYIRNESVTFSATISGGVAYRHFILGYTTPEEFAELSKSSVPYFDLEVWHYGVLHSGPLNYAKSFSYDELFKAAVLWDKVSSVAITNGSQQGIVFLYDPFVAAGAAVAFPGRSSVNCPMGWMASSLNYNAIVTSGSWGNFHEFHHNFQNFGVGYTGEVTNNALTLVDYTLFTKISSARSIGTYGAQGLGGWNNYTSATWALTAVNAGNINSTSGLAVYATLLHNFGQDAFINARQYSGVNYLNRWADITHQDFSYFDSQITAYTGGKLNPAETNYPTFVPVSSVFQTGRSYMYDNEKRDIETMQPYVIPYGEDFTVDLRPYNAPGGQYADGSVVIGNGFTYEIIGYDASGANGTFTPTDVEGVYKWSPNSEEYSGTIRVTLKITTEDGRETYNGHSLDNVDLLLGFQQSHETNKMVLERTTYTYAENEMYTDAQEAYENDFGNYEKAETVAHTNFTQNCNTDAWFYLDNENYHTQHPDAPDYYFASENNITLIEGKLYIQEDGKYRIFLRGRNNCAVYYSLDGENFVLGATIKDASIIKDSAYFRPTDENTYFDLELPADSWVYFKEVLINDTCSSSQASYIGLGLSQWTVPLYTTTTDVDEEGNVIATHYWNSSGQEVTAEEASNTDPIAPVITTKNQPYVNAYRNNYEFSDNTSFESDYFYTKKYNYNYVGDAEVLTSKYHPTSMEGITNYRPWGDDNELLNLDNLFDGDSSTNIHTHENFIVTEDNPLILAFDMGETVTANTLTLGVYTGNSFGSRAFPKVLVLEGSLDGETWFEMGRWSSLTANYSGVGLPFNECEFRYFKVTVTRSNYDVTSRFALSSLELSYIMRLNGNGNNNIYPDSSLLTYTGNWEGLQMHSYFGHVYHGSAGAEVTFDFTGTRLAIITPQGMEGDYKVYIDGKLVSCIENVKEVTGDMGTTYISEKVESGTHTVRVVCNGDTYIDSFVYYNEG